MLRAEIFEVYLGNLSDLKSAVGMGDGARYWMAFWALWELLKN